MALSLLRSRWARGGTASTAALLLGCGGQGPASVPRSAASAPTAVASTAPGATKPTASAPVAAPSAAPPSLPTFAATYTREVEGAVAAIAVDRAPHVAALTADAVHIHDARGWRTAPLPKAVAGGDPSRLGVFYGRDLRVRVAGMVGTSPTPTLVYLRGQPQAGLAREPGEIGRLGAAGPGDLLALLGTADPEIVCRLDDQCVVKRVTGWTYLPAPADLARLAVADGAGYAIAGRRVLEVQGAAFAAVGPEGPWTRADAFAVAGPRRYVVETDAERVHVLEGDAWRTEPSPVAKPRSLWAPRSDRVWLVGDGGLARSNGTRWERAAEAPGPLRAVLGRGDTELWVGGRAGLHRVGF